MPSIFLHPNMTEEIIDTYDDDIIMTSREGRIIKASKISGRHYNLRAEDLLGQSVYELERKNVFSPAITPLVIAQKKKVVTIQTTATGEKVLITGMPFFDEQGEVQFVISYSYEVSELLIIQDYLAELEREMQFAKEELAHLREKQLATTDIVMESRSTVRAYESAANIAHLDVPVTIYGEYGVGKTTLAKTIHLNSSRKDHAFIEVDCEVIPEAIFEQELFGTNQQLGLCTLANEGTIYLKKVDALSPYLQSKLATVVREKQFTPLYTEQPIPFNARIIASAETEFTGDLHYLLNIVTLELEPLHLRLEDLQTIIEQKTAQVCQQYHLERDVSNDFYHALKSTIWKGNLHEALQVIEKAIVHSKKQLLSAADLPLHYQQTEDFSLDFTDKTLPAVLEHVEKTILQEAQEKYRTTTEIAKHLGISQPSVVRKLKKYHELN